VSVRKSLADRNFRLALTGELIYAAPFAAIVVFGALLARHEYGLSPAATEVAFGVFFVISFVVRAVLVWQSPIRHKLALFRVAAILTLVGLAVVATGHSFAVLLVAMALLGVPHGLTFPLTMGLVAEGRHRDELASINAHLSASVQAVNLALPLLLGFGIDEIGYRPMFLLLLVPVAGAAVAQLLIARSRTAPEPLLAS
jgi:MFS family permease